MDTDTHLYYYVEGTTDEFHCEEGVALVGPDFHGGMSSVILKRLSLPTWQVTPWGSRSTVGRLTLIHRQRSGYALHVPEDSIATVPCLLTTDSHVRWMGAGFVTIECNDPTFDETDSFDDVMQLCGRQWLGLVSRRAGDLYMIAFSDDGRMLQDPLDAYCPEWADSLDEPDVPLFRVFREQHG